MGAMTTNQSESFNHVLAPCRDLPITAIVHYTFKQANAWFIKRRDLLLDHNKHLVPWIEDMNKRNLVKARNNHVQMFDCGKGVGSVLTRSKAHTHNVSMEDKTCTCGKWQLFHYPCVHALAVCAQEGWSIRACVASEYTTKSFMDTWSQTFNPLPDMAYWREYGGPKHIPSKVFKRVKKGRPPTKRRHGEMDEKRDPIPIDVPSTSQQPPPKPKRVFKCSTCGGVGHTKRTCSSVSK